MLHIDAVSLFDFDPELGKYIQGHRQENARREFILRSRTLNPGDWRIYSQNENGTLGILLIDGLIARHLTVVDNVSAELLGPGDLIMPNEHDPDELLATEVRWSVLIPTRVAFLDRRFALLLTRYPEVTSALFSRMDTRTTRLATCQAIAQLNGVELRLRALFSHLAERFGHVCIDGIHIPIALPHSVFAELVGARRPTVTSSLGALSRSGAIERKEDGTWLIKEPLGLMVYSDKRKEKRKAGALMRSGLT